MLEKPVVQKPVGNDAEPPYPASAESVHSCPPFSHSHWILSFLQSKINFPFRRSQSRSKASSGAHVHRGRCETRADGRNMNENRKLLQSETQSCLIARNTRSQPRVEINGQTTRGDTQRHPADGECPGAGKFAANREVRAL